MGYLNLLGSLIISKQRLRKSSEQLEALQENKLRKMLRYTYDNSDYYRRAFTIAGITERNIDTAALTEFPTIDKNILMNNFDSLITVRDITQSEMRDFDGNSLNKKCFKGKYHVVHSSGSTGNPCYFLYDKSAWKSMLVGIIRAALWDMSMQQIMRYLAGGARIAYIAATDGRYGGAMAVGDGISGMKAEQLFLDIKTPLSDWTKKINEFKPNMIIGYPSAIKILGELVKGQIIKSNVFRIVTCGEPLGKNMRAFLENTFNAQVINFYGASESLAVGVEADNGMYLFDDMNVIETAEDGIYLTCLYNFAQPLIRYKISDRLVLMPKDDIYPFSKAESVFGRNEDILWFEDSEGKAEFLHPLAVEGICIEGLRDYQFMQLDSGRFVILAEADDKKRDKIHTEINRFLKNILNEKGLANVHFHVRFVKEIMPDKYTGKKRLIIPTQYGKGA